MTLSLNIIVNFIHVEKEVCIKDNEKFLQILRWKLQNSNHESFEDNILIEDQRNEIYRRYAFNKCDCMAKSDVGNSDSSLVL